MVPKLDYSLGICKQEVLCTMHDQDNKVEIPYNLLCFDVELHLLKRDIL